MPSFPSETDSVSTGEPKRYRWLLLAGVWLIYYGFGLIIATTAPLVHSIRHDLGIGDGAMGAIMGAWPLVYIVSAVPCGALLDRIGPRRALALSALLIAASGAARALAVDELTLFLAVAIFGLGGPLISIGAPKLVAQWFEGKDRGFAMGIYITGPALGGITALSLTNAVLMPMTDGNWRAVLLIFAAFVVLSGAAWLWLARVADVDGAEALSGRPGLRQQATVFADLHRLPVVQTVLAMSVCTFFLNHGLNNWMPEILRRGGLSAAEAGYWASIPVLVGIAGALTIPRLAVPERRQSLLTGLILSAFAATLLLHLDAGPGLAVGLALQGTARASLMTLLMLTMVEAPGVGARHAGSAGGLFFSAAEIGGVLGPLTLGLTADLTGSFDAGLWLLSGLCCLLALLQVRLHRLQRPGPVEVK